MSKPSPAQAGNAVPIKIANTSPARMNEFSGFRLTTYLNR
jgi:hypothetical protein